MKRAPRWAPRSAPRPWRRTGSVFKESDAWYLADALPVGMAAAIVLLEHRWAIPLRNAIRGNDGVALVDRWLHPEDLVAAGMEIGLALDDD